MKGNLNAKDFCDKTIDSDLLDVPITLIILLIAPKYTPASLTQGQDFQFIQTFDA